MAAGYQGTRFIAQLAQTTGADVAASSDATGAAAKGGNWVQERSTGSIAADNPFDPSVLLAYDSLLAALTFSSTPTNQTINEDTSLAFSGLFGTGHVTLTTAGSTWAMTVIAEDYTNRANIMWPNPIQEENNCVKKAA